MISRAIRHIRFHIPFYAVLCTAILIIVCAKIVPAEIQREQIWNAEHPAPTMTATPIPAPTATPAPNLSAFACDNTAAGAIGCATNLLANSGVTIFIVAFCVMSLGMALVKKFMEETR